MRKIVYLILMLSVVWLVKLSYDVVQYSQTLTQLQQQFAQSEQRYALLNDQLVALQRQLQNGVTESTSPALPMSVTEISPTILIKQQLQLIQFALDQQQMIYALEHLNQLQQQLTQYTLAPALQHSLTQAIEQDRQAIQQYVLAQTQQQQQLDQLLQQLDQKIQQHLQTPNMMQIKDERAVWWQWFKLEKIQRIAPDLMQRSLILKEVQLRLLIATQALQRGQIGEYRQSIQEVMQLLIELPDQQSQQIKMKLEKVLNLPATPTPKLTTLALLG